MRKDLSQEDLDRALSCVEGEDDGNVLRGCLFGIIFSLLVWLFIALVIYAFGKLI